MAEAEAEAEEEAEVAMVAEAEAEAEEAATTSRQTVEAAEAEAEAEEAATASRQTVEAAVAVVLVLPTRKELHQPSPPQEHPTPTRHPHLPQDDYQHPPQRASQSYSQRNPRRVRSGRCVSKKARLI